MEQPGRRGARHFPSGQSPPALLGRDIIQKGGGEGGIRVPLQPPPRLARRAREGARRRRRTFPPTYTRTIPPNPLPGPHLRHRQEEAPTSLFPSSSPGTKELLPPPLSPFGEGALLRARCGQVQDMPQACGEGIVTRVEPRR